MTPDPTGLTRAASDPAWKLLAEFSLPDQSGSDRVAQEQVMVALEELGLSQANAERLKAAAAKATLKAVECGSYSQPGQPIRIRVLMLEKIVSGRSWGFFLIHKMEAQGQPHPNEQIYLIELFLYQEDDVSQPNFTTGEVP